ncbi:hypothetical protein AAVH_36169 [Aphelenchoides avenae]|nr:hypothetical protein AAVH_36169 [Aphelenchus avenae]
MGLSNDALQISPAENEHETSSEQLSASFVESSTKLRARPDIAIYYRTPTSGSKFSRRSSVGVPPLIDYFERYDVPNVVLLRICRHLNKKDLISLAKTCRRFRDVCYDWRFWTFINLEKAFISEPALHCVLDRRTEVMRLSNANIQVDPPASWYTFPAEIPACLTHLDLSSAKFTKSDGLVRLLERCHKLQALSLEALQNVTDETCKAIAQNKTLKVLNLLMARTLTEKGLLDIMMGCKKLSELNIGWAQLDGASLSVICGFAPKTLRRLSLAGAPLTDENVQSLCLKCTELVELDLSDNMHITEKAVKTLRTLKKLKILSLSRCYEVEPVSYVSFDSLDVLNIYGCLTDEGLKLIRDRLHGTTINASPFVNIARPTVNESVTSIWEKRTRDWY